MTGTPVASYRSLFILEPNGPIAMAPALGAFTSSIGRRLHPSLAIPELPQVGGDGGILVGSLGLLVPQRYGEPPHLLVERLVVLLGGRGAHEAARREHVAVLADLVERGGPTETGHVGVLAPALVAAPGVVRAGDLRDVLVGELAVRAIHQRAHLAGIDEEGLAAAITEAAVASVGGEEPEADRDLGRVEELARQRDHAVDQVRLDDRAADLALTRLVRRHRPIGEHEAGDPGRRQVADEVLNPGEVRIAGGRGAVDPALVVLEELAPPVTVVEGRIGQDPVGLEVRVAVVVERVAMSDLGIDAANREVHLRQAPSRVVGLLAVDADAVSYTHLRAHETRHELVCRLL